MKLRAAGLATRTLGTETVILDLETSRYLTVTGAGVRILELLAEERTLAELTETITEEYEVNPDVAREDTSRFIDSLREAGLVEGRAS